GTPKGRPAAVPEGNRRQQSEHALAAGAAAARNLRGAVRVVVVRKLLALADLARGADPDHALDDLAVAVAAAAVVDEPRRVAVDSRVDRPVAIEREAPDVTLLQVADLPRRALLGGDLLARVVDD